MHTFIRAPFKYIQEPDAIKTIGSQVKEWGKKALILITNGGINRFGSVVKESFADAGISYEMIVFAGDITLDEIKRIGDLALTNECDCIVGIGGGRILDTVCAAADEKDLPFVIVPTTASSDAPCSALSVIHDENGKVIEVRPTKTNPNLVLMDTRIVAEGPSYFMSAGIGDALATYFEAKANVERMEKNGEPVNTMVALALSKLCYDLIMEHGEEAVKAIERKEINYALEQTVMAATYLSGFGFENGGVAASHAINEGFSIIPKCEKILHGVLVGFGVLIQFELENRTYEEKKMIREFMKKVGLKTTLMELGLDDLSETDLKNISEASCMAPPMQNMPFEVTPSMVYNAIKAADNFN